MKCPKCSNEVEEAKREGEYHCANEQCPIWIYKVTTRIIKPENQDDDKDGAIYE